MTMTRGSFSCTMNVTLNSTLIAACTKEYDSVWLLVVIKCKKIISLQHRVRAMKSHIQNSTNHFFWDDVIARSHIALTIHLTWPHLTFTLPHYHASKETSKEKNENATTVIMSNKLLLFSIVCACNPVARITYTVLVETLNHAKSKRASNLQRY